MRGAFWRRTDGPEAARAGHVDARVRAIDEKSRQVWDNPVLWREMCTWAYGRKVLVIKAVYWLLFSMAAVSIYWTFRAGRRIRGQARRLFPRWRVRWRRFFWSAW